MTLSVYDLKFDVNNYRILAPVDRSGFDGTMLWINGTLKGKSWNPPKIRYSEPEPGCDKEADITYISPGFYTFNDKALNALGDILSEFGELLPLSIDGQALHAFNPHNEVGCFVADKSEWYIKRNGNRGRLITPAFDVSKIKSPLFQVPEYIQTRFYVTEGFKHLYDEAKLTGLLFEEAISV